MLETENKTTKTTNYANCTGSDIFATEKKTNGLAREKHIFEWPVQICTIFENTMANCRWQFYALVLSVLLKWHIMKPLNGFQ